MDINFLKILVPAAIILIFLISIIFLILNIYVTKHILSEQYNNCFILCIPAATALISILTIFIIIYNEFSTLLEPYSIQTEKRQYISLLYIAYFYLGSIYSSIFVFYKFNKKLNNSYEFNRKISKLIIFFTCLTMAISSYGYFIYPEKIYNKKIEAYLLKQVPKSLNVKKSIYAVTEHHGIGFPGDNETGFIVYKIPTAQSELIYNLGISYLNNLPEIKENDFKKKYELTSEWMNTPIKKDNEWKMEIEHGDSVVMNQLCRYGFCIDIEKEYEDIANTIITNPGSYYAYRKGGATIIISPQKQMIIYLYSG